MNQEVDPFVPVKGKHFPYGGWCRTCMNNILEQNGSDPVTGICPVNILNDYPGISRGYQGDFNYCRAHEDDRARIY